MPQETWTRLPADKPGQVANTNLAAALATLGATVRTERVIDERSGKEELVFMLSVELKLRGAPVRTKALLALVASGELERTDPCHPMLDCLRGLHNAHAVLDWIKRGDAQGLSYQGARQRTCYVLATHASCHATAVDDRGFPRAISTRRLGAVAALGVLGVPLLTVEGTDNARTFFLPRCGFALAGTRDFSGTLVTSDDVATATPYDAAAIMSAFTRPVAQRPDGSAISQLEMDQPEHPFLYAYHARENRQRLLAHIDRAAPLILLRSRTTERSAFVHRDAEDSAWDQATRHLT